MLLTSLAHDSMEGRETGSPGAARAARFIAGALGRLGLEPAGDSGFYQRVPLAIGERRNAQGRVVGQGIRLLPNFAALDTIPEQRRVRDVNVIGVLRGADPVLKDEAVVVGAHFDHEGIGDVVNGDSIYNGADDDASGVVAVLEIARVLAAGARPKRSVVFLLTTGEELGMLGTRWYALQPTVPIEKTVADLQVEMIGRPDSLSGGAGRGWLTGYERSTMGESFAAAGLPIGPDQRKEFDFFLRSDNIVFARLGVPAHTLSSFNMHTDYHQPSDDVSLVDFAHMARVIEVAAQAVRLLADGEKPAWKPGGRPGPI
jgi:Zn-dependent M28 family amino/carboxypeptidase